MKEQLKADDLLSDSFRLCSRSVTNGHFGSGVESFRSKNSSGSEVNARRKKLGEKAKQSKLKTAIVEGI